MLRKHKLKATGLLNTQKVIIFVLSKQKSKDMNLTEKEKDLIETIRNYRRAYPNGARQLEQLILELVYELMEESD